MVVTSKCIFHTCLIIVSLVIKLLDLQQPQSLLEVKRNLQLEKRFHHHSSESGDYSISMTAPKIVRCLHAHT